MGVGDGKWEGDRALRRHDAGWHPQVHGRLDRRPSRDKTQG